MKGESIRLSSLNKICICFVSVVNFVSFALWMVKELPSWACCWLFIEELFIDGELGMKEKAVLWKWLVGIPKPRVVSVSEWRAKYPRFFCFLLFLLLDVHLITTRVSQLWATYIARLDWELLTNKQKTRTPNETRCIERHGQGTRRREIAVVCRTRENAVCDRQVRGGAGGCLIRSDIRWLISSWTPRKHFLFVKKCCRFRDRQSAITYTCETMTLPPPLALLETPYAHHVLYKSTVFSIIIIIISLHLLKFNASNWKLGIIKNILQV